MSLNSVKPILRTGANQRARARLRFAEFCTLREIQFRCPKSDVPSVGTTQ
ncbi:hypothetical protein [Algicella marina]|uniref:Uncharacterized protein n=1 Tax=Algicella marina TaxID=2683284 RepID=A0A6P1SYJ3_9RHOB|nr:hypothetical protein [Algicella marina]QHQ34286.1 hypothetical protein GO499_03305 [Algicella marina]